RRVAGFSPVIKICIFFWVSFYFLLSPCLSLLTGFGRPPQHLQEVPPTPHPSSPHRHHLACTQTRRRYLYPSLHESPLSPPPVTARRTHHDA
ncbi:hypothetical protein EDB89DRAFT_1945724, partial [Lactarius sanguifluus]